jgi:hypothetical protein
VTHEVGLGEAVPRYLVVARAHDCISLPPSRLCCSQHGTLTPLCLKFSVTLKSTCALRTPVCLNWSNTSALSSLNCGRGAGHNTGSACAGCVVGACSRQQTRQHQDQHGMHVMCKRAHHGAATLTDLPSSLMDVKS